MEPLDLEPIKARPAAATPGQWVWLDHNLAPEGRDIVFVLDYIKDADNDNQIYEIPIEDGDAALIVNAPTDLAALVAEVERLRAQPGAST